MKLAIFTDTFTPQVNGVSMTFQRFVDFLDKKGIEYRLFVPETKREGSYNEQVLKFASMPFFLYPECRFTFPNVYQIKKELKKFQPDLIHIATPINMGLSGLYYGNKLNIPTVASYHTNFDRFLGYYNVQFMSKALWKYLRWFHQPMLRTFVPSNDTKQTLLNKGLQNIGIWSRGVDCELFQPSNSAQELRSKFQIKEKNILTYVGRLAPEKDLDVLMEIANKVPSQIKKNVHWLVVGDGPMKEKLQQIAPENMTFTGYIKGKELADIYAGTTVFVFPSTTETFGNVVLESLACGTPVICAKSGGVQEIVKDQKNGILCEAKDVQSFINAITNLLQDNRKLKWMGLEARNDALKRSWDKVFDDLLNQYEQVLQKEEFFSYA